MTCWKCGAKYCASCGSNDPQKYGYCQSCTGIGWGEKHGDCPGIPEGADTKELAVGKFLFNVQFIIQGMYERLSLYGEASDGGDLAKLADELKEDYYRRVKINDYQWD